MAIATFKKIVKFYVQDLLLRFSTNQNPLYPHLGNFIGKFFDFSNNIEKEQLLPFSVYIMKLLNSKIDILTHYSKFFVENNIWATRYIDIPIPDGSMHAAFAYLSDN